MTIEQWGNQGWISMYSAFAGCTNLDVVATDQPNLFWTTDIGQMFNRCSSLVGNISFSNWDTSNVTNMSDVFNGAEQFNQPIGSWDVGNVRWFWGMFWNATAFNQPLGAWNMSKAEGLGYMFQGFLFQSTYWFLECLQCNLYVCNVPKQS